ncbi:MAG: hypothetical protein KAW09_10660, partial [Thermoplasmata archaeon]|nr:hypothetical protein [Thermoplasmata archaeon]
MKAGVVSFVACLLVVSTFHLFVEGGVAENSEDKEEWTLFDTMEMLRALKESSVRDGEKIPRSNAEFETFSYEDGPYPIANDDGSFGDIRPLSGDWGDQYVSDIMYRPPNNPGGGFSSDATGGAGEFAVGDVHEDVIGDMNGNGILEWVSFFSYRPWGMDGIDNDGDGCVDEKTYGDWDGQVGCDLVPDQFSYFGVGGIPDIGGKNGTLAVFVDWYSAAPSVKLHRVFSMPLWVSYSIGLIAFYPQVVDNEDFISFYSYEAYNNVNANPEMDSDLDDYYVGSIDARDFPAKPPKDHACFAGYRLYMGITYLRDDGYVVTSFELREHYDDHDWNGDGDKRDSVAAYYVIDPVTGKCDQGVNGGVYGVYPRNSGKVMTPMYTSEYSDRRDWNGNGVKSGYVLLWHDIDSTWSLVGHRYTSFTFTSKPGPYGFGFWGIYSDDYQWQTFPLKFGGSWREYAPRTRDETYFFLTADEDGDPTTMLPKHFAGVGYPTATPGRLCILILVGEYALQRAGYRLIGGIADANGDGDLDDWYNYIYCPDAEGGDGHFVVEPTSKAAKGLYEDFLPLIWEGSGYYDSAGEVNGLVIIPSFNIESALNDDANGNLKIENVWYHVYYWIAFEEPTLKIVEASWVGDTTVQPGGTVVGRISILNYGNTQLPLEEDGLIFGGKSCRIQGLYMEELGIENGMLDPDEVVTVYFALRLSSGVPIGSYKVIIYAVLGTAFLHTNMTIPVYIKMHGQDLACYRHRQNALRAIRAFDMDDDKGLLHHLIQGKYVNLKKYGAGFLEPEEAVHQLIEWYEEGCKIKGKSGVETAHSAGMRLTGKYGMGISYWGFNPG